MTLLFSIARTSTEVAARPSRNEKRELLASALRSLEPGERHIGISYLAGQLPQGKIGLGWAALGDMPRAADVATGSLTLREVDDTFEAIARVSGTGSSARKRVLLEKLFARTTSIEREFLFALLSGNLRQGALGSLVLEAVALAANVSLDHARRAAMLAGSIIEVGEKALSGGEEALRAYSLVPFRPILPMLASPSESAEDALATLGEASLELKVDGARIQVHKEGSDVRVYSRALHDITERVPEIVAVVHAIPERTLVLDGEAIALDSNERPLSFQTTMRRFGRQRNVNELRESLPLHAFFFDAMRVGDTDLLDVPFAERSLRLERTLPERLVIPRLVTSEPELAERFYTDALTRGYEGLVAKSLAAPYEAGRRGAAWLKIKPAHTLDLVVLAVERGSGRRSAWLSNLHLGARDPQHGGFVMLGKTFKGMTDEMLAWQTQKLRALAIETDGWIVHVKPELVVEVAFGDIEESPQYPAGLALRFARVRRYREDKRAEEADTIDAVRAIFEQRRGK
jgi:DNA ligase-1